MFALSMYLHSALAEEKIGANIKGNISSFTGSRAARLSVFLCVTLGAFSVGINGT